MLMSQTSHLNQTFKQTLQGAMTFEQVQAAVEHKENIGSYGLSVLSYNILADAYTKERNMNNQYESKKSTPEVV